MRILITGGAGFVGHHVVESVLKNTDFDVVLLDRLTYAGDINKITDINGYDKYKNRLWFLYHDLRSPISEIKHKQIGKIDYCIHLAAESHVENSLRDPLTFAYNIVSTTNLLQYLKDNQQYLIKYIGFNTDEVFGPAKDNVFHKEDFKFYPSNPYSASKAGQWAMEYAFWNSFRMPIMMVHCMNIFGERQHPEKFIPLVTRNILTDSKITLHGIKGGRTSSRCWIHAREVGNALLFLLNNGNIGETYNVAGEEQDVLWIANRIHKIVHGKDIEDDDINWMDFHSTRPGHDWRYAMSCAKLMNMGFRFTLDLEHGLNNTVKWMIEPDNIHWLKL